MRSRDMNREVVAVDRRLCRTKTYNLNTKRLPIFLEGRFFSDGIELRLRCDWAADSAVGFTVRVLDSPESTLSDLNSQGDWRMNGGLRGQSTDDPFRVFAWYAKEFVANYYTRRGSPSIGKIDVLLNGLSRYLVSVCDPGALKLARKFDSAFRFRVYRELLLDKTGRIAELIERCPGLLIFALGLESRGTIRDQIAKQAFADITEGHDLDQTIDRALDSWHTCVERWGCDWLNPACCEHGWWHSLVEATESERSILKHRQKQLIKHASARVHPRMLLAHSTKVVDLSEIPKNVYENARWFRQRSC